MCEPDDPRALQVYPHLLDVPEHAGRIAPRHLDRRLRENGAFTHLERQIGARSRAVIEECRGYDKGDRDDRCGQITSRQPAQRLDPRTLVGQLDFDRPIGKRFGRSNARAVDNPAALDRRFQANEIDAQIGDVW
jgi:hypothetical protein